MNSWWISTIIVVLIMPTLCTALSSPIHEENSVHNHKSTPHTNSVCFTPTQLLAAQNQLTTRMRRIIDQYVSLWRMESRGDYEIDSLTLAKTAELTQRTEERKHELEKKLCFGDTNLPISAPADDSSSDNSDSSDDSDSEDGPRYDASIHPYSAPFTPYPSIFTGLTERDIRNRHGPTPPPASEDSSDDSVDYSGGLMGNVPAIADEDDMDDDSRFVASIAPPRDEEESSDSSESRDSIESNDSNVSNDSTESNDKESSDPNDVIPEPANPIALLSQRSKQKILKAISQSPN